MITLFIPLRTLYDMHTVCTICVYATVYSITLSMCVCVCATVLSYAMLAMCVCVWVGWGMVGVEERGWTGTYRGPVLQDPPNQTQAVYS